MRAAPLDFSDDRTGRTEEEQKEIDLERLTYWAEVLYRSDGGKGQVEPQYETMAVAAIATSDEELNEALAEASEQAQQQAFQIEEYAGRLASANEEINRLRAALGVQQECPCVKKHPEDYDGPERDCPQHGDPTVLGYCPMDQYKELRKDNDRLYDAIKRIRAAARKAKNSNNAWDIEDLVNAALGGEA